MRASARRSILASRSAGRFATVLVRRSVPAVRRDQSGDLTAQMSLPWQSDFLIASSSLETSGPDVAGAAVARHPWRADGLAVARARAFEGGDELDVLQMIDNWWRLGFVLPDGNALLVPRSLPTKAVRRPVRGRVVRRAPMTYDLARRRAARGRRWSRCSSRCVGMMGIRSSARSPTSCCRYRISRKSTAWFILSDAR